jgi:hypothetical protein
MNGVKQRLRMWRRAHGQAAEPEAHGAHLWLLTPREDVLAGAAHPWRPPYEKTLAVVVRAVDAQQARDFADDVSGNEGRGVYTIVGGAEDEVAVNVWLRPEYTDCTPLSQSGELGVIVVDRWEG